MSKGSRQRRAIKSTSSVTARWEAVFGPRQKNEDVDPETGRVRYKPHPETGKMIPDYMWAQYDMLPKIPPKTHFVIGDSHYEYRSPIDGKLVSGKRARRYDLESNDCRPYEGRDVEQRAANSHSKQEEKKFERVLDKSMAETLNDIKYQNNPPPERDKNGNIKASWTFGLD